MTRTADFRLHDTATAKPSCGSPAYGRGGGRGIASS